LEYIGLGNEAPAPFKVVCPNAARDRTRHSKSRTALRIAKMNPPEIRCSRSIGVMLQDGYKGVNFW
jgi:hypothetical protein